MAKRSLFALVFTLAATCGLSLTTVAGAPPVDDSLLRSSFNLADGRTPETQYFILESKFVHYTPDGKRNQYEVYRLYLQCVPGKSAGKGRDEYTCVRFAVQTSGTGELTIPALAGWTYVFAMGETGLDEKGQVFGIPHAKFENLRDGNGQAIDSEKAYMIYNSFIDFHSFCDALAGRTSSGKGIQDLSQIGQKIVHASAFTQPPVNLGSNTAPGSYFKNGEVTLVFKGLGLAQGAGCAIVGFDSGDSSFKIIMKPVPEMEIRTTGASHYQGDLYIDLKTKWVRKVDMHEVVVSETTMPVPPNKVDAVTERVMTIQNVSAAEVEKRKK